MNFRSFSRGIRDLSALCDLFESQVSGRSVRRLTPKGDLGRQSLDNFRKCSGSAREWCPLAAEIVTIPGLQVGPARADAVARRRLFRPDVVATEVTSGG